MAIKTCVWCNKEFETKRNNKIYCSIKCHKKGSSKTYYLKNKEKAKEYSKEYNKHLSIEKKREYISNRINSGAYKLWYEKNKKSIIEKNKINAKQWRQKKINKVFELLGKKCMVCGFDIIVDIHHINQNKKGEFDWDDIDKLLVLCPNHHLMIHRGKVTEENILKEIKNNNKNSGVN